MNFFVTGGTLEYDARCYVEREADRELFTSLLAGGFCYVLTARQMGKSSLMVRTARRLRAEGLRVAALDLTMIGGQNVTPEQWYYGLADTLGQELGLESEVAEFWRGQRELGPSHRFMKVLRQVVLPAVGAGADAGAGAAEASRVRLVVFVDEIDFVRSLKFSTDEFFAAIRECYNHRTRDSAYHGLTFCLLGVASPADLIQDPRTTPFNIGRRIELSDFTAAEAAPLCEGLVAPEGGEARVVAERVLGRILHWTSGHPYLTQRLCRAAAEALRMLPSAGLAVSRRAPGEFVDGLCEGLFFSSRARECDDNLAIVRERLLKGEPRVADLLDLYLRVWQGRRVMDDELDPLIATLRLSGIVRVVNGRLRERNAIYLRVFDRRWVRANMPQAELRRQREAFVKGVGWAAALASVIIVALLLLSAIAARQTAGAYLAQARAWRISGLVGQRERALEAIAKARVWGGWWGDLAPLREEAIGALQNLDLVGLPDLGIATASDWRVTLDSDFARVAIGRPDGSVRVQETKSSLGLWILPGTGERVSWIRFAPGSSHLAIGYGGKGEAATSVRLWRLADPPQELLHRDWPVHGNAVDFDASGSRAAFGADGGKVHLVRFGDGADGELAPMGTDREQGPVVCVRFDPAGRWLAVGTASSLRVELRALDGTEARVLTHSSGPVDFEWHPLGRTLAVAYETGEIAVWDIERRFRDRIDRPGPARGVTDLAYTPDGQVLGALSGDGAMRFWHTAGWRLVLSSVGEGLGGRWQFRRHEPMIASVDRAGRLRRFQLVGGRECLTLEGDPNWSGIGGLAWDRQGAILAGCGRNDAGFLLWQTSRPESLTRIGMVKGESVRFDPARREWRVAGAEGLFAIPLALRTVAEDRLEAVVGPASRLPAPGRLGAFGFATNGLTAVAVHDAVPGHVRVFEAGLAERGVDLSMGSARRDVGRPGSVPGARAGDEADWDSRKADLRGEDWARDAAVVVEVAPSGAWVLAAIGVRSSDGLDIAVWSRVSGRELRFGPARIVARVRGGLAVSGDGRWLASAEGGMVEVWRTGTWESVGRWPLGVGVAGRVAVAFGGAVQGQGQGALVAVAGAGSSVAVGRFVHDPAPRLEEVARLRSPGDRRIESLSFSPDSTRLAAATADRVVQVWDLEAIRAGLERIGIRTSPAWGMGGGTLQVPIAWEVRQPTPMDVSEWEGELWRWTVVESLSERLRAVAVPGDRAGVLFARAQHLFQLGRLAAARQDLAEATAIDPAHPGLEELQRKIETGLARDGGNGGFGVADADVRGVAP